MIDNGLAASSLYPYVAMQSTCPANLTPASRLASYEELPANADAMLEALKKGPIAVYVTVDDPFQLYTGGVFTSATCGGQVNHAVVVVGAGYDADLKAPYWWVGVRLPCWRTAAQPPERARAHGVQARRRGGAHRSSPWLASLPTS